MNKVDTIVREDSKVIGVNEKFMNPENLKELIEQQEALIKHLAVVIKSLQSKLDSYTEQSESSGDMPVENTVMVRLLNNNRELVGLIDILNMLNERTETRLGDITVY